MASARGEPSARQCEYLTNQFREVRARQLADGDTAGARRAETGYVFTTPTSKPVGPNRLARLFCKLVTD